MIDRPRNHKNTKALARAARLHCEWATRRREGAKYSLVSDSSSRLGASVWTDFKATAKHATVLSCFCAFVAQGRGAA